MILCLENRYDEVLITSTPWQRIYRADNHERMENIRNKLVVIHRLLTWKTEHL